MSDHMFVLNPPSRLPTFWSPWKCVCGVGGTGGDDAGAEFQYRLHTAGLWPALTEPVGKFSEAHVFEGRTVWVQPRVEATP